ncbi:MAG: hypothetical protein Q8P05_03255 [Candidatus Diapherotrites archaeon]|nr:hypothetical protein [Candidatus Diapherotrites archaeon]MDZ4256500.1 hypothetical protein [archaeon]
MARVRRSIFVSSERTGQAAVTDALFLLVIISGLTAFMLLFSANYGKGISDQVNRNDSFEFVASALKTIMYQSVARNADEIINPLHPDPEQEVDYLMALVKEDFADDTQLSVNTQKNLARSVFHVMRPIADSHDYIFAINTAQKYVFVILWRTEFIPSPNRFGDVQVDPQNSHRMYSCAPLLSDNALQRLALRVGNTTEAQALVNMVEFTGNSFLLSQDTTATRAGVTLATWTATVIPDAEWQLLNCTPIAFTV